MMRALSRLPLFDPRTALYDGNLFGKPEATGWNNLEGGAYHSMQPGQRAHGFGARRRLNGMAILLALFVPVAIFVGTFCTMSFNIYYRYPQTAILAIVLVFFFTLVLGAFSAQAKRIEVRDGQSSWSYFLFVTALVACFLGSFLGYLNMTWNAEQYYDYISLRKVEGVEPGAWQGRQLLDAGEVKFKVGNHIDANLGSLFHVTKTYCAAPLVNKDGAKLANYDFWAVGMDCCSMQEGTGYSFTCGDTFKLSEEPVGLRVMDVSEIQGYKLAVEQATAAHGLQSQKPIFLYMMKSPYSKIKQYFGDALDATIMTCVFHFFMQSVLVATQAYTFGRGAPSGHLDVDGSKGMMRHLH